MTETLDISTEHCTIERDGPVVILTMNRPEKKNALSPAMLAGLVLGYEYVDEHDDVACAVLTGAGGNFCSGMDLVSMGQTSEDPKVQAVMARGNNPHWKALLRDYRLSKPLIAAVEGYALAGGFELAITCDLIVAAETSKFGITEVKRGLVAAGGGLVRLPRQIPPRLAMEFAIVGDFVTAGRAYDMGLVNRVVPEGTALEAAKELAAKIAANGPLAMAVLREMEEAGVLIEASGQPGQRYDAAIIATSAPTALSLLPDATAPERDVLAAFKVSANRVVVHRDEALMPRRRQAWASAWAPSVRFRMLEKLSAKAIPRRSPPRSPLSSR